MRRPRAIASLARGTALNAAPSPSIVVAAPAHASLPDSSTASTDPNASVDPLPREENTCAVVKVLTIRRWAPA